MKAMSDQTLVRDLLELVAALDRRVPRLEREAERDIARDARELRRAALKRIAELERSVCAGHRHRFGTLGITAQREQTCVCRAQIEQLDTYPS